MERFGLVVKKVLGWVMTTTLGIVTAYNLYRQEFNTSAPPLISLLDKIPWWDSFLVLLLVIAIIIIEILREHRNDQEKKIKELSSINSKLKNDNYSIYVTGDGNNITGIVNQNVVNQTINYNSAPKDKATPDIEKVTNEELTPKQFYILDYHAEWIISNANARAIATYLKRKYLEIARIIRVDNVDYITNSIDFYDPDKQGTLEYAIIVYGEKITAIHPVFKVGEMELTGDPKIETVELFTVTIIQGGEKTSRVTFDTNIGVVFSRFSQSLLNDLKGVFSVRGKNEPKA